MRRGNDIDFASDPLDSGRGNSAFGRRAGSREGALGGIAFSISCLDKVNCGSVACAMPSESSRKSAPASLRADQPSSRAMPSVGRSFSKPGSRSSAQRRPSEDLDEMGGLAGVSGLSISAAALNPASQAKPAAIISQGCAPASKTKAPSAVGVCATPARMERAKLWTPAVENAFRFQEAGYRDEREYFALTGMGETDRWPDSGLVKKLVSKASLGGPPSNLYFPRTRSCQDSELQRVKLYIYDETG
mmetsp:Transcript_8227/g.17979  ORF Transcript_8227/g.17979 Transcript_8227/m.17979 type:complete len:246 (-) Transcript_8227:57-794(-)|eukprot:6194391-Pleurochrysis_carterae.AAC.4